MHVASCGCGVSRVAVVGAAMAAVAIIARPMETFATAMPPAVVARALAGTVSEEPRSASQHGPLSAASLVLSCQAGKAGGATSCLVMMFCGAAIASVAALNRRTQRRASMKVIARATATAEAPAPSAVSVADKAPASARSYHSAVGGRTRVSDILDAPDGGKSFIGKKITVCGWVRTIRAQKEFSFMKINDGSSFKELQIVVSGEAQGLEALTGQGAGASVRVEAEVVESPAQGQEVEISCSKPEHSVRIIGGTDPKAYPLAKKKHSTEFLRTIAHLRPRSNLIGAVMRVRNTLAMATHKFFQERGFLYIHTPIITAADTEGAGEMFRVSTDPVDKPDKESDGDEFFGQPAFLTVSGQLSVENYCCALGDVYTFGPTFRAENSATTRHLAEFWMIEPELAFADLTDDMDCAEDYLRHCVQTVLETCKSDLEFFTKRVDDQVVRRLELIAAEPFKRISYTEAVELLQQAIAEKKAKFEFKVEWGEELQTEHERYLTEKVFQRPTIVYNYPKDCKAFYMRQNDDGKTVAAMDILCEGVGELVGGSQREERLDILDKRLEEMQMNKEDYWWYRELRQYGSVPHAGFGVGFERLIMLCTGVQNIRDVIPFPRYPGHAAF